MVNKKQAATWNIAATHWLTAGFAIPFIVGFIGAIFLGLVFNVESLKEMKVLISLATVIYLPLIYWFGVMYSARYINKKYIIKDVKEITQLATVYLIIVGGGLRAFRIINETGFAFEDIGFIFAVIAFYIASNKYIHSESFVQKN